MTGDDLNLKTWREKDGTLSGRADFGVIGNRKALELLRLTIDHVLSQGVTSTTTSGQDGSTLTVRIVNDGVNV